MGLKPGGNGSREFMTGVFIEKRKIADVINITGTTQFPSDVALQIVFEPVQKKDGGTFTPSMRVYGNFDKDPISGVLTGWGSAFKIDRLINRIGEWNKELTTAEIPPEALHGLPGREVFVLRYCKGTYEKNGVVKADMADYEILANLEEPIKGGELIPGDEWLLSQFKGQVEKGKEKKYKPEAWLSLNGDDAAPSSATPVLQEEL